MSDPELRTEREHRSRPVFVPMALVVVTLVLLMLFQSLQLIRDRELLRTRFNAQQAPLEEVQKVSQQLQAIAKSTYTLSASGNENAALVVDRLKQAGITVTADGIRVGR